MEQMMTGSPSHCVVVPMSSTRRHPDAALTRTLQDYVKASVAPYKYPRAIEYVANLPRTETGKLQRFELRRRAAESAANKLAS